MQHFSPSLNVAPPVEGVVCAGELMIRAIPRGRLGGLLVRVVPEEGLSLDGASVRIGRRSAYWGTIRPVQSDGTCEVKGLASGPCELLAIAGDRLSGLPQKAEIRVGEITNAELKVYARRCVVIDWKYRLPSGTGDWHAGSNSILTGRSSPLNEWGVNGSPYELTDWDGTGAGVRGMNGDLRPADQADFGVPQVRASKEELRSGGRRVYPIDVGKVFVVRYGYANRGGEGEAVIRIRSIESSLTSSACGDLRQWCRPPVKHREGPQGSLSTKPVHARSRGDSTSKPARITPGSDVSPVPSPAGEPAAASQGEQAGTSLGTDMQTRDKLRLLGRLLDQHETLRAWVLARELRGRLPAGDATFEKHLAELNRQFVDQNVETGNGYLWAHKPAMSEPRWAEIEAKAQERLTYADRARRNTGIAILRISLEKPDAEKSVAVTYGMMLTYSTRDASYSPGSTTAASGQFLLFGRAFVEPAAAGRIEIKALRHESPKLDINVPESGVTCLGELMILSALNPGLGELAVQVVREPGLPPGNALIHIGRDSASWEGGYPVRGDGTCTLDGLVPGPCEVYVEAPDLYRVFVRECRSRQDTSRKWN